MHPSGGWGTLDVPIPFSPPMENYVVPSEEDIIYAAKRGTAMNRINPMNTIIMPNTGLTNTDRHH